MTFHKIKARGKKLRLLGVRSPDEWKAGHIRNARLAFHFSDKAISASSFYAQVSGFFALERVFPR